MSQLKYWQAINQALAEEMARDDRVVLIGEDVAAPGGAFSASRGLLARFGPDRVRDTPISELALAGIGVGAALAGARPIVEIMFSDFLTLAMDQIVNQAAKLRFMTGGRASVPLVIRTMVGAGRNTGPQHGQSLEAWFAHVPGLKVCCPSTPRDARGLLKAAIRDDNPVMVFESLALWGTRGEVPDEPELIPFGQAQVRRAGAGVTLVGIGGIMARAERAADRAAERGVDVEVIDLRTAQPLDVTTLRRSVEKTGRLVIVHDAVKFLGISAEIAAWAAEEAHGLLRAPVIRVGAPFSPVPFAPELESRYFPSVDVIVDALLRVAGAEAARGTRV
jgi:pyruvate dehydrogenase E1 component beta subunit